jgi:hypothetical protein
MRSIPEKELPGRRRGHSLEKFMIFPVPFTRNLHRLLYSTPLNHYIP